MESIESHKAFRPIWMQAQIDIWWIVNSDIFFYMYVIKLLVFVLEWTAVDEDQADMHVWEDNWDDDTVEDDFSNQLRYR